MWIIAKVGAAIQRLLGPVAQGVADRVGVIERRRKFSALTLLQTFVLGYLKNPQASDEALAQMAAQCGVVVTPQAVEQRQTPKLVEFLKGVFQEGAREAIGSNRALAPILERFPSVRILDGSTVSLPESQAQEFAGCGGAHGQGKAALKLQTELELRSGAVTVAVEPGRCPDAATPRQHERHEPGSLSIRDLGYFCLSVFAAMAAAGEYFLSRLQYGTAVMLRNRAGDAAPSGPPLDLMAWLTEQAGPFVDQWICLGKEEKLPCRLIAWRVPVEQANRRRQKLRASTLRKRGREPSAARLAWCDWTILITNLPPELLTAKEAVVLYRSRWQVELLFKRWKSLNLVDALSGATDARQMVRVWGRLIMSLVQHWLLLASVWGDPTKSLHKACQAIRDFASQLAASLECPQQLHRAITRLCRVLTATCRRNQRSKPGTFELLNDVELLDFRLT
jgi:hypothetical protein